MQGNGRLSKALAGDATVVIKRAWALITQDASGLVRTQRWGRALRVLVQLVWDRAREFEFLPTSQGPLLENCHADTMRQVVTKLHGSQQVVLIVKQ